MVRLGVTERSKDLYEGILDLPRPPSRHPAMPRENRAAQFAPFAALTGFDEMVREEARETEARPEVGEETAARINRLLREGETRRIEWFEPDPRKPGGRRETITGEIRRVDPINREIRLADGRIIDLDSVTDVE